jgi:hypothetical protein
MKSQKPNLLYFNILVGTFLFLIFPKIGHLNSAQIPEKNTEQPCFGFPISGGKSTQQAVPLTLNRDYVLDSPLPESHKIYFFIPTEPGKIIDFKIQTLATGRPAVSPSPYVYAEVQDNSGKVSGTVTLTGEGESGHLLISHLDSKRYYLVLDGGEGTVPPIKILMKVKAVVPEGGIERWNSGPPK